MDFRGRRIFFNFIGAILTLCLIAVSLFSLLSTVFNVVYIKTYVYQFSMFPTLNGNVANINDRGDRVYINKFAPVSRGDIVVSNVTWNNGNPIIKRLVGIAGDEIYIEDEGEQYVLYVNDKVFYSKPKENESFHENDGGTIEYFYNSYRYCIESVANQNSGRVVFRDDEKWVIKVYENEFFLMGDNWADSTDSLMHGPVSGEQLIGRVDLIVPVGNNIAKELLKHMLKSTFVKNFNEKLRKM